MKQNPTLSLSLDRIATTALHKPTNELLLMLEFVFRYPHLQDQFNKYSRMLASRAKPHPGKSLASCPCWEGSDCSGKDGIMKMLGFVLPVFHRTSINDLPGTTQQPSSSSSSTISPTCLQLEFFSPTRELAIQIHGECAKFGSSMNIRAKCVLPQSPVASKVNVPPRDPRV